MEYAITGTKQEIFDRVAAHLRKQGSCSMCDADGYRGNKLCLYRTEDGRKCAIGALIPDDHPAQNNTMAVRDLAFYYPGLIDPELLKGYFLSDLQGVHDAQASEHKPDFEPGLCRFANEYGLVYTAP